MLTCSGFVITSKTSAMGASNSREMRTSSSFGNSMRADPVPSWVSLLLSFSVASRSPADAGSCKASVSTR